MKKRHIIFLLLIVIGLVSIIFSITYALTTSVSEGTSSDYDLSYTFTISDDTWTVTVEPSKTKVYEIALTNPYSDSIRYGVAYKINNSDTSLEDVNISTTKDSESLPEDLIGSNELKTVSVMIENNSTSTIEVNLIIINGYKNGGDLIIPDGYSLVESYPLPASLQTLTLLGLTSNGVKDSFTEVATTDEGVFEAEDDLGTSYYFRGAATNNYVYFAGFYWRIIRINGDGSIRMIYDGTSAHVNGKSSEDRQIGTSEYNTSNNDNAYVGYMYGTAGSSTYETTHANTNNSTIKDVVDTWYETNIKDTDYEQYVVDAIYCNDREVYSGTGIGTTATDYKAYNRIDVNKTPTLECSGANDKFTVNSSLGNGDLTYPIGLITADEVAMAGGIKYQTLNSDFYLYTGNRFWTMSPKYYGGVAVTYFEYGSSSDMGLLIKVSYLGGVRGVISIDGSILTAGSGVITDPFRVEEDIIDNDQKTTLAGSTLTLLGLSSNIIGVSFESVATTNEGIFKAEDDLGISYYFRGAVENNYVKFAGYYWRIIRINGDGSIRMIYDGTSAHANGESSEDRQIGTSKYNSNANDNAYVGYMYGTTGSSTYEDTHANTNNSTIKTVVDNWYKTNIVDTGYSSYVVDAIYCNDREVYSGTGIEKNLTYYKAYNRLVTNNTPTLECTQVNDKFTVNSTLGNGALTYPVGLITADELVMAGAVYENNGNSGMYETITSMNNDSYYLYTGNSYYTMTSLKMYESMAIYSVLVFNNSVSYTNAVRPVISISPSTIKYGNGSSTNPFRLTESI